MRKLAGRFILFIARYKCVGSKPDLDGAIIVVAPHTSAWDFTIAMACQWNLGIHSKFLITKGAFRGPAAPLLRLWGGIAVDRSHAENVVEEIAKRVKAVASSDDGSQIHIGIAPEGSRYKKEYWKSGFYRIAVATQLPLILAYIDGPKREAGLGPRVDLTGDPKADMDQIRAFYGDIKGIKPKNTSIPRLRMENMSHTD